MSGSLLINEPPRMFSPSLAVAIGLSESIVLQQIHFWLLIDSVGKEIDGQKWIYNSVKDWKKNFPWWSERTIWQILHNLEEAGLIVSDTHNVMPQDRTKWYRINYDQLAELETISQNLRGHSEKIARPLPEITSKDRHTTYAPSPETDSQPAVPVKPKPARAKASKPAKERKEKMPVPPELIDFFCQKTKVFRATPEVIGWGKFTEIWLKPLWLVYHVLCADNLEESRVLVAAAVDDMVDRPKPLDINSPASIEKSAISIKALWAREGRKGGRIGYW